MTLWMYFESTKLCREANADKIVNFVDSFPFDDLERLSLDPAIKYFRRKYSSTGCYNALYLECSKAIKSLVDNMLIPSQEDKKLF